MSRTDPCNFQSIAIVGMGCIFPGSSDLKAFWNLLFNGTDAISRVPEQTHWSADGYFDPDPERKDHVYCNRGGFLPVTNFSPLEFGIPPKNLEVTDTAQLLGLHVAKMALKDAGILPNSPVLQEKRINVILGVTGTQELVIPLGTRLGFPVWEKALDDSGISGKQKQRILNQIQGSFVQWQENAFPGLLGNVVAGRIANRLNLSGTNCVCDAACASSLSAVHMAVMELSTGRCDISITGGVDTLNDIFMHMCFAKTGVLSHSGDARPFSSNADGTVLGEGIGMLVLKRLEDARKNRDRIYAVIRGIGTSSDGKTSGIYAPDAQGQLRAIKDAYSRADVSPQSVGLIEAHGTGTRVGDKIEFTALHQFFGNKGDGIPVVLGSVKSMIGHTKAAAGAAGMIKAVLALHNKVLPPTLKIREPDPQLGIDASRFYLNQESKPWVSQGPRRSGVSAFGFGGSNFHLVLEEAQPEKSHVSWDGSVQIFAFGARDNSGLLGKLEKFLELLDSQTMDTFDEGQKNQYITSIAHKSREAFSHKDPCRILAVHKKTEDLPSLINQCIEQVKEFIKNPKAKPKNSRSAQIFYGTGTPQGKMGFLFPGQGSQYPNMGKDLFSLFPEALQALESARKAFDGETDLDQFLFPLPEYAQVSEKETQTLQHTRIAQPAIGAVSFAMARVLERFRVQPAMTCGHSFGELSALAGAGWLSQENFFSLASARGKLMAQAGEKSGDPGAMLAIQADLDMIEALIQEENLDLILTNRNAPSQGVVSGTTRMIDKALTLCKQREMKAVKLPVAAAFHSSLVEQAAEPFTELVKKSALTPGKICVLSNTTGKFYPLETKAAENLLGQQLAHPVDFISNIQEMYAKGIRCFVEVGPKSILTGLTRAILREKKDVHVLSMDASSGKDSGIRDLALVLADLAAKGYTIDLTAWEDPAEMPQPAKMAVPLSGANIKPAPIVPDSILQEPVHQETVSGQDTFIKNPVSVSDAKGHSFMDNSHLHNHRTAEPAQTVSKAMKSSSVSSSGIHLLENGFDAIRELQAQTASAHEKFLETQALAAKTLGAMLEHSRMVVSQSVHPVPAPADQMPEPIQSVPKASSGPMVSEKPTAFSGEQPSSPPQVSSSGGMDSLKEIVSRLTGYPVEMLEPSMSMESDLGIDSIKKVEILSELEKRFPAVQGLSSDQMAKIASLEDMCQAIDQTDQSASQAGSQIGKSTKTTEIPSAQSLNGTSGNTDDIAGESGVYPVLVEVVSELTGFPADMLDGSMELDSDLGVDSIKRVEILSCLERKLPGLPSVPPDEMARVKTLEDIARVMTPAPKNGQVKKKTSANLRIR